MSLDKKSFYPLFESICVMDGEICRPEMHEERYQLSYCLHYGKAPTNALLKEIEVPHDFQKGRVKLRVMYNQNDRVYSFSNYNYQPINSLKCVDGSFVEYATKKTNRKDLEDCFAQRGSCDDVLIIKNGEITDTSYGNICFWDGSDWFTPIRPLLKGTARAHFIADGLLKEAPLRIEEIKKFRGFKIINAMGDFATAPMISIKHLYI